MQEYFLIKRAKKTQFTYLSFIFSCQLQIKLIHEIKENNLLQIVILAVIFPQKTYC